MALQGVRCFVWYEMALCSVGWLCVVWDNSVV